MATLHAAEGPGTEVHLFESTRDGGRKILISGGGRCNVLPETLQPERYISDSSPNTLRRMLCAWPLEEQRAFFEERLGLPLALETETHKYFPRSGRARDLRDALVDAVRRSGAKLHFDTPVNGLDATDAGWTLHTAEGFFGAHAVIVATGGLSFPKTGSDGSGLGWAKTLGLEVVPPYAALTPLTTDRKSHHRLAGLSVTVRLSVGCGPSKEESCGGFLFTHRGYSGPSVLDISHRPVRDPHIDLRVNWTGRDEAWWEDLLCARARPSVGAVLRERLPSRLVRLLCEESACDAGTPTAELRRNDRRRLVSHLCDYRLPWSGHEGLARAEVTGGGIRLSEVDRRSLESKGHAGLFFCGEVLDAFGPIGGHNFAWAWSTGRSAGRGAARL